MFQALVRSFFAVVVLFTSVSFAAPAYPENPDPQLTPGDVCHRPSQYRYPEKIAYCERNVDPQLKREIIKMYDRERGYRISQMDRQKFKIDHYIPLCMGGSNDRDNLWPQHETVYNQTDHLEALACEKMAQGRLRQAKAIEYIKSVKNNLELADQVTAEIEAL